MTKTPPRAGPTLELSLAGDPPPPETVTRIDVEAALTGWRLRVTQSGPWFDAELTLDGKPRYSTHWHPELAEALTRALDYLREVSPAAMVAIREAALAETVE